MLHKDVLVVGVQGSVVSKMSPIAHVMTAPFQTDVGVRDTSVHMPVYFALEFFSVALIALLIC